MRILFAQEQDNKFYLSFFRDVMKKPRVEFESKQDLENEIRRRGCEVQWLTKD